MRKTGVYQILNTKNNKCYIGQSLDIQKRLEEHYSMLNSLIYNHHSAKLQEDWDKYGDEAFVASIVEECPEHLLEEREKYWIAFYNSAEDGYNVKTVYNKAIKEEIDRAVEILLNLKENI